MNYKVVIHPEAKQELKEARDYYRNIDLKLAQAFLDSVDSYLKIISENPFLFQIKYKDYREAYLRKFPFSIIYEVDNDYIYVDSVFLTHRNPENKP